MAYCLDRFVNLRCGSPLTFDEQVSCRQTAALAGPLNADITLTTEHDSLAGAGTSL